MGTSRHHSMPRELIIQAAALRHIQDYMGALNLIEANIGSFNGIDRVQGRLQGFYAARDGGLLEKARALALQIAAEDPHIPSVRAFLSEETGWAG